MGWFDEQIRERKKSDRIIFEDSFKAIAGAVMGKRMSEALNDDRKVTTDAIGEILKFYHVKIHDVPDKITDMNEVLEYLMRPFGIMRRTVRLDKGWYKDAVGAMLGTRSDDGSVVALMPYGLRGYRFFDRKSNSYVTLNSKTEELIEHEAIAFYKPFPLKEMGISDFLFYIKEQLSVSDIIMLIMAGMAVTLVGMLMPRLNSMLFGKVIDSGRISMLAGTAVFMLCTSFSSLIFTVVKGLATARISTKVNVSVEAAAMMRILSLPAEFFKDYNAGELSNRLGYISLLANQMVDMALATGLTGLFSLAYITQIFKYARSLVGTALLIIFLMFAVSAITVVLQVKVSRQQMKLASKESGITHAMINGIQKIRLSGAEQRAFARWANVYSKSAALSYNPPMFLRVSAVISLGISLFGTLALYLEAVESGISVSDYYAFNTAYAMVSGAFLSFTGIAASVAGIGPILEMIFPILKAVPEIDENKHMVMSLSGGVELNHVSFRYRDDMPLVLDDLNLKIHPGQYVAIVGKTGCGKSTMMRILLGFEKPQKGAVYYDGRDLESLDPKSLRRRIGTVMQDGRLFNGEIFANIVISAPWLTLDDAWEAAKIAGFSDDIKEMPMGMNTMISEGQGGISGGQRQRLMIARAIAPKPKILMFDEATSALDNVTQKKVSDALGNMKCTRIVIAHRLSTIRQCDRIIVLEGGKIIEDGTYDELIEQKGFFAELVSRQQVDAG